MIYSRLRYTTLCTLDPHILTYVIVYQSVKEEVFWRNYFYRISLIKQSAQLTALAAQQQASGKEEKSSREDDLPLTGTFCRKEIVLKEKN